MKHKAKKRLFCMILALTMTAICAAPAMATQADAGDEDFYDMGEFFGEEAEAEFNEANEAEAPEEDEGTVLDGIQDFVQGELSLADALGFTEMKLIMDEAGVLSENEYNKLLEEAERITDQYQQTVAVVFVPTTDGQNMEAFADDYYDYNGYGIGDTKDGLMLVVSIGDRAYHVTTTGRAIGVFTDRRLEDMDSWYVGHLSDNEWGDAAMGFLKGAEYYLEQGEPEPPAPPKVNPIFLPIFILIGILVAGAPVATMRRRLKSVAQQVRAAKYVPENGVQIRIRNDRLINVTQQVIPKADSSRSGGGGSSTHMGGSGMTHGGHGGRF